MQFSSRSAIGLLVMVSCITNINAFTQQCPIVQKQSRSIIISPSITTTLSMSTVVTERNRSSNSFFGKRMRDLVLSQQKSGKSSTVRRPQRSKGRPDNLLEVKTIEEYRNAIQCYRDGLVVVRFYATWCKACKAVQPSYYRLANTYKDVMFLEVPVTDQNASLHQGLGVPSIPFGHIYNNYGLVEELKISKKYFGVFEKVLHSYVSGGCELPDGESEAPYIRPPPDSKNEE